MLSTACILRRCGLAAGAKLLSGLLFLGQMAGLASGAGTILDSNGFENPTFVAGPIVGQNGWANAGSGTTSAVVQGSVVHSGSQALLVTRAANSDQRFLRPLSGFPTQRYVIVDWDMRVSPASASGGFGPFFGIDAYDDEGTLAQLGSFGVDASTAELLYQAQGSGEILAVPGVTVPFNTWHHYRMVFDFQTDMYHGYYDGVLRASSGFVDGGDSFSDADIAAFAAGPDGISQGLSASAVFDNFVIRDGLLGDYNLDGVVNNTDYTTWRTSFGNTVSTVGNDADGNRNGVVDAGDYVIWRNNFGATLAGGAGAGAALETLVVPEPVTVALLLLAFPAVLFGDRRRRAG